MLLQLSSVARTFVNMGSLGSSVPDVNGAGCVWIDVFHGLQLLHIALMICVHPMIRPFIGLSAADMVHMAMHVSCGLHKGLCELMPISDVLRPAAAATSNRAPVVLVGSVCTALVFV